MRHPIVGLAALLAFALATPAQAQKESDILKVQQVIATKTVAHLIEQYLSVEGDARVL